MRMFLARRAMSAALVLVSVSILTFVIARVLPADPAALYAGRRQRAAQIQAVRIKLGLDQPLPQQYLRFVGTMVQGDWGVSFKTKRPIGQDILTLLPSTLELLFTSMLITVIFGISLGAMSGWTELRLLNRLGQWLALLGVATPPFWLAMLLQLLFFGWLRWLPISGRISNETELFNPITQITGMAVLDALLTTNWLAAGDALQHLILPAIVLAISPTCLLFRLTRAAMLETKAEMYVTAARARGVRTMRLLFRHAMKTILGPLLNALGLILAYSLTGTILVETMFDWPGLGRYLTEAILDSDFPVIMVVTLITTIAFVWVDFMADVIQAWVDPRASLS